MTTIIKFKDDSRAPLTFNGGIRGLSICGTINGHCLMATDRSGAYNKYQKIFYSEDLKLLKRIKRKIAILSLFAGTIHI